MLVINNLNLLEIEYKYKRNRQEYITFHAKLDTCLWVYLGILSNYVGCVSLQLKHAGSKLLF